MSARRLLAFMSLTLLSLSISTLGAAQPLPLGFQPAPLGTMGTPLAPGQPLPGFFGPPPAQVGASNSLQPIAQCVLPTEGATYAIFPNLFVMQTNLPPGMNNNGWASRDPTTITALRLQARDPYNNAYFVTWNGDVVHLSTAMPAMVAGHCQFAPGALLAPRLNSNVTFSDQGVPTQDGFQSIPDSLVKRQDGSYAPPLLVSAAETSNCLDESDGDKDAFAICMVHHMGDEKTQGLFDCSANQEDTSGLAICTLGVLGGDKEKAAAQKLLQCHDDYGDDYTSYPLCLAGQSGGEVGRAMGCLKSQTTTDDGSSDGPSITGFAVCYGGSLLHMNTETQVAVECAATSGGVPVAFAVCAGGRLSLMEINKCFDDGVGKDGGCFGENNTFVKAIRDLGNGLQLKFGPTNDAVIALNTIENDFVHGPGENNDIVKTGRQLAGALNNLDSGVQNTLGKINEIIPGVRPFQISIKLPKISVHLPRISTPKWGPLR